MADQRMNMTSYYDATNNARQVQMTSYATDWKILKYISSTPQLALLRKQRIPMLVSDQRQNLSTKIFIFSCAA